MSLVQNESNCNALLNCCSTTKTVFIYFIVLAATACATLLPHLIYEKQLIYIGVLSGLLSYFYIACHAIYIGFTQTVINSYLVCTGENNFKENCFGNRYIFGPCAIWIFMVRWINPILILAMFWVPYIIYQYDADIQNYESNFKLVSLIFFIYAIILLFLTRIFFVFYNFVSPSPTNIELVSPPSSSSSQPLPLHIEIEQVEDINIELNQTSNSSIGSSNNTEDSFASTK